MVFGASDGGCDAWCHVWKIGEALLSPESDLPVGSMLKLLNGLLSKHIWLSQFLLLYFWSMLSKQSIRSTKMFFGYSTAILTYYENISAFLAGDQAPATTWPEQNPNNFAAANTPRLTRKGHVQRWFRVSAYFSGRAWLLRSCARNTKSNRRWGLLTMRLKQTLTREQISIYSSFQGWSLWRRFLPSMRGRVKAA
jgi:hypothetical protein